MEESFRERLLIILAVASVVLFITTVSSCTTAYRQKVSRDKEMATRLDAEEKLSKFTQERNASESKLKGLAQELEQEKAAHQLTQKALVQEQLMNQTLKEELAKVTKLKEALEEDLKEALVTGKSNINKRK